MATLERARAARDRRAAAVSWALAVLSACALAVAGLLLYAERTVFDRDAFADRAEAAFTVPVVRDAAARRLTNAAVGTRPNLVALRPLPVRATLRRVAALVAWTPGTRTGRVARAAVALPWASRWWSHRGAR